MRFRDATPRMRVFSMSVGIEDIDRVFEVMPDAMIAIGARGDIVSASRNACALFGYVPGELIGKSAYLLLTDATRADFESLVQAVLADGATSDTHVGAGRRASGADFPVELHLSRATADGNPIAVVSIHDIAASEARRVSLLRVERIAALSQLTRGLSHDFNNILTVILCNCEMLSGRVADMASEAELVEGIQVAASHAVTLTRQLGSPRSRPTSSLELCGLNELVVGAERALARLVGEDIQLHVRLDPGLPEVLVGPRDVEQVLITLAANARDAMPTGGHLIIETGVSEQEDDASGEIQKWARLSVIDDGAGMHESAVRMAFDPFFSAKKKGGGTGLGLLMVRSVVESVDGTVELSSTPGEGTKVDIYLPCTSTAVRARPEPTVILERPPGLQTVLLVEAATGTRVALRKLLESGGLAVLDAGSEEEALQLTGTRAHAIDLLLIDADLTGARDVVESLRRSHPEARVLFLTGRSHETRTQHITDMSVQLQKPLDPRRLMTRVGELLANPSHRVAE